MVENIGLDHNILLQVNFFYHFKKVNQISRDFKTTIILAKKVCYFEVLGYLY